VRFDPTAKACAAGTSVAHAGRWFPRPLLTDMLEASRPMPGCAVSAAAAGLRPGARTCGGASIAGVDSTSEANASAAIAASPTRFGVQGVGFGVQGVGFGVQGVGFGVQDGGFGNQSSGFRNQSSGCSCEVTTLEIQTCGISEAPSHSASLEP
jgi:hypothetical protein